MGNNNNCLSIFCCVCLKKKIQKTNELTHDEIKILKKKTKLNKETIINWHELFIVSVTLISLNCKKTKVMKICFSQWSPTAAPETTSN